MQAAREIQGFPEQLCLSMQLLQHVHGRSGEETAIFIVRHIDKTILEEGRAAYSQHGGGEAGGGRGATRRMLSRSGEPSFQIIRDELVRKKEKKRAGS